MTSYVVDVENYAYSLFGLIAIQENFISHQQLLDALEVQKKTPQTKIGVILNKLKYLQTRDIFKILKTQADIHKKKPCDWISIPDFVLKGLVYFAEHPFLPKLTRESILIAQKIQTDYNKHGKNYRKNLIAILHEDIGLLSNKDLKSIYQNISISTLACPDCLRIFLLYNWEASVRISCPICTNVEISLDFSSWQELATEEQIDAIKFAKLFKKIKRRQKPIIDLPQNVFATDTSKYIKPTTIDLPQNVFATDTSKYIKPTIVVEETKTHQSYSFPNLGEDFFDVCDKHQEIISESKEQHSEHHSFLEILEKENQEQTTLPLKKKIVPSYNATQVKKNETICDIKNSSQVKRAKKHKRSPLKKSVDGNNTRIRTKEDILNLATSNNNEIAIDSIPCLAAVLPLNNQKPLEDMPQDPIKTESQKISNPELTKLYSDLEKKWDEKKQKKEENTKKQIKKLKINDKKTLFSAKKRLGQYKFMQFFVALCFVALCSLAFFLFYGLEISPEIEQQPIKKIPFVVTATKEKISVLANDPAATIVKDNIQKLRQKSLDNKKMNALLKDLYSLKEKYPNSGDYWNLLGRMYLYKIFLNKNNPLLRERKEILKKEALQALFLAKENYHLNKYKSTFQLIPTKSMPEYYINNTYGEKIKTIVYKNKKDSIADIENIIFHIDKICDMH